jgi:hypothetical protein
MSAAHDLLARHAVSRCVRSIDAPQADLTRARFAASAAPQFVDFLF